MVILLQRFLKFYRSLEVGGNIIHAHPLTPYRFSSYNQI
jgi:hypothetical protein